jgi:hypothetical protein
VLPVLGLLVAFCLIVGGLALWLVPVALVVAGVLIGVFVLLTDFDALKPKGRS